MIKTRQAFLVALTTSLTTTAFAEEPSPIIVTATRTAQTADESLASVTIITKEQIEQQQATDLTDLLTSVSGIDMTNSGGLGKDTSIFMRGTSSKHILVMIDGVKVGSATLGSVALQHIPVSQIERIEIVRGPRSSLYGSEAIGGVIQIFTKKAKGQEEAHFEMGYGAYTTNKLSAGFSLKDGNTSYSLNTAHLKTAGFDALKDSETDNDGYENNSVSFNLSHKLSKTSTLQINTLRASGYNEYDGSPNNTYFVQQTSGLQYTLAPLTIWNMKFNISESLDQTNNFSDATFASRFNTRRSNFAWQNDINIGTNQLFTVGVDYQNDHVDSSTPYDETSRDNTAAYIQHQWTGKNNDVQLALRNDKNQSFGSYTTGNIAWGQSYNKDLRLILSHGTAFRAPTFNDLYYPAYGKPGLMPENSKTSEFEIRSNHNWGNFSVSAYNTEVENLISSQPTNINKVEIKGIELRIKTKLAGWDTQAELAMLDPLNKDTGKILQRRSQETLRIDMDRTSGKWSTGLSLVGVGSRYNDDANTQKINGYGIVNLRASYTVSKKMSIKWKIENLLDKEYETTLNYLSQAYQNPGLSGFVSIAYQGF